VVAGQTFPQLGPAPYVIDLTQGLHPAWNPYFSGLPEIFTQVAPAADGVVLRGEHHLTANAEPENDAIAQAAKAAQGRPLVIAVQDAGRTPWMRAALTHLVEGHPDNVFVLCTGIPEDQTLVPAGVPSATTSGRNKVVLEAIARQLTR
jgi:beta-N-acetylhexosaminidase